MRYFLILSEVYKEADYTLRYKKLRGHRRIWKAIKLWEQQNIELDLEELQAQQRKYVKVWVSPYCDYDLLNSETPEPGGKTRKLILESLLNIYDSWKEKLEHLDEPYYLKLWLYEPNISRSQVVCALGPYIGFYKTTFNIPEAQKQIQLQQYGSLAPRIEKFTWTYAPEENALAIADIGEPEEFSSIEEYRKNKRYIKTRLKRPYRKSVYEDEGKITEYFWFKRGAVWIGEK